MEFIKGGIYKVTLPDHDQKKSYIMLAVRKLNDENFLMTGINKEYSPDCITAYISDVTFYIRCNKINKISVKHITFLNKTIDYPYEVINLVYEHYNFLKENRIKEEEEKIKQLKASGYTGRRKHNHNKINNFSTNSWSIKHPFRSF